VLYCLPQLYSVICISVELAQHITIRGSIEMHIIIVVIVIIIIIIIIIIIMIITKLIRRCT